MYKKNKIFKVFALALTLTFVFNVTALAESSNEWKNGEGSQSSLIAESEYQQVLEEAEEYLTNFRKIENNEYGKEFSVVYQFNTAYDFNKAKAYIAEFGVEAFNNAVDIAVGEIVGNEPASASMITMSATTPVKYKTISGNGTHYISDQTSGLASFNTLGTVEYIAALHYTVTVSNGQITGLNSLGFSVPYISTAGGWEDVTIPFYSNANAAGATANYTISKTLEISIGDFAFEIRTEYDNEVFSILTTLS
jgi:hypothetical protein